MCAAQGFDVCAAQGSPGCGIPSACRPARTAGADCQAGTTHTLTVLLLPLQAKAMPYEQQKAVVQQNLHNQLVHIAHSINTCLVQVGGGCRAGLLAQAQQLACAVQAQLSKRQLSNCSLNDFIPETAPALTVVPVLSCTSCSNKTADRQQ